MSDTKIAELSTERLKLSDISHNPHNPRYHSRAQIEQIADSIKDHGYAKGSMTVQRSTMSLVAGNGVYDALVLLEYDEADFIVMDMDDNEAMQFLIRDNRLSELSRWDMPVLQADLATLKDEGFELVDMAFDLKAMEVLNDSKDDNGTPGTDDEWVSMTFRIPQAVIDVVESELDRIGGTLTFDPVLDKAVQRGLTLEAICMNSALTPLRSVKVI